MMVPEDAHRMHASRGTSQSQSIVQHAHAAQTPNHKVHSLEIGCLLLPAPSWMVFAMGNGYVSRLQFNANAEIILHGSDHLECCDVRLELECESRG